MILTEPDFMNTTWSLTKSALKMFARNRQALFFTLFMPVLIMTIFGFIGFDRVPKIDVGAVVTEPTPATQQFVERLEQIEALKVTRGTETDERQALADGERVVVLLVPGDLMPDPDAKTLPKPKTLTVLTATSQQQQAGTALSIVSQFLDKTTIALTSEQELFVLETKSVDTKSVKYIDFLLPGIVAMSVMQMAVFSVAFVFADYKEKGILKRLLATPLRPHQFVTANVVTRLVVALIQTTILIAMGVFLFHSHVYGAWWLVLLISILGGVMFLGLGFTISGIAKTVDAVPAIANLVVFPMLFLSGVFFPTSMMPEWLQNVTQYLPLTYFAHALRDVMADGVGIGAVGSDLLWMGAWSVVLVILAMVTFRFEERRVA